MGETLCHIKLKERLFYRKRKIDMGSTLKDSMSSPSRYRIDSSVHESLSDTYRRNRKICQCLSIIMSRICYSTCEDFIDDISTFFRHKFQCLKCILCSHVSYDKCNNIELFWRDADVSDGSFHKIEVLEFRRKFLDERRLYGVRNSNHETYLLPEWARKTRVKENSQSLCPTISSVTNTGTCCFPLWTPNVCPTNSGAIIHDRDQVLITLFLPEVLSASTFLITRASM